MEAQVIYIAGPYSSPWPWVRLKNILRALKAAVALAKKGHTPLCPHAHTCLWWLYGWGLSWETYMRISIEQVRRCDALLYLAPSTGANIERDEAQRLGMQIFGSVEEVPRAERSPRLAPGEG